VDRCAEIRKSIVNMMHYSKSSHIGSCLSIVELLYVLYFKVLRINPEEPAYPERDRFILSKAHASAALYAVLAERGFFPKEYLDKYYIDGGLLPGHLDREAVPGVEVSAGSLGHGLSLGVGMAMVNQKDKNPGRIFVLLGDGECNEGSVWEAVMLASTHRLKNITAIVDFNGLQGLGYAKDIIKQDNLGERWRAFGWEVLQIDGHNLRAIEKALNATQNGPKVIIANTIKGKGVSFMENCLEWHYKSPDSAQLKNAVKEIEERCNEEDIY